MNIKLDDVGKRFNKEWIFRHLSLAINHGSTIVIQGHNGSGKSTLLKLILGYATPSEGCVIYDGIEKEPPYKKIGFASPYLDLFGDLTLLETLNFNISFKGLIGDLEIKDVVKILGFQKIEDRLLKNFSSGMLQRVKLAMAIFSDVDLVLLDEPCANLDKMGIKWYQEQIGKFKDDRSVVVCSNQQEEEYAFCNSSINIQDYKK